MEIICYLCTIIAKVEIANCKILMAWISTLLLDPLAENSSLRFNMTHEIWKDIQGYEGLYQVSNLGNIKNIRRDKLLKKTINSKGYNVVGLYKNNIGKQYRVGRLVSENFIPNPYNRNEIDHINTIRNDDRVDNLRWCTHSENIRNPITHVRLIDSKKGERNPNYGKVYDDEYKRKMSERCKGRIVSQETRERMSKAFKGRVVSEETRLKMREAKPKKSVNQFTKDGAFVKTWQCIMDIERELKIYSQHIIDCCKNRAKSAGGYIWRYAD